MLAAQGRVGDIIDELFDINSEYLGFISSNLAKVRHWSYAGLQSLNGIVDIAINRCFVTFVAVVSVKLPPPLQRTESEL